MLNFPLLAAFLFLPLELARTPLPSSPAIRCLNVIFFIVDLQVVHDNLTAICLDDALRVALLVLPSLTPRVLLRVAHDFLTLVLLEDLAR